MPAQFFENGNKRVIYAEWFGELLCDESILQKAFLRTDESVVAVIERRRQAPYLYSWVVVSLESAEKVFNIITPSVITEASGA